MSRIATSFKDICDTFTDQYSRIYTPEATFPMGGINVECFFLTAYVEMPVPPIQKFELHDEAPAESARLPFRKAYWKDRSEVEETPVLNSMNLKPERSSSGRR